MSMSDHIKQQVLQEFFCQKDHILQENGKTRFFCFTRAGEPAHISKISYLFGVEAALHIVLICCTICGTEQPKEQPQIVDMTEVRIQFFSSPLVGPHVLVLFFIC